MQGGVLANWSISSSQPPVMIQQRKLGSAYNSQLGATTTHSFSRLLSVLSWRRKLGVIHRTLRRLVPPGLLHSTSLQRDNRRPTLGKPNTRAAPTPRGTLRFTFSESPAPPSR